MKATALLCDEQQQFSLEEVELGECAPDQVAIKTHYSGVSIGTEFALIQNKLSWGPYPLCTGYMGTGVVKETGSEIDDLEVGDWVYFRGNDHMELADGTEVSCVEGAHCSHMIRQIHTTHGVAKLPEGADPEVAAMFVMPAVGLYGVDMANPRMGDVVLVYGTGLIGQGVIAACAHRGCEIIAVDLQDSRLEIARKMGADCCLNGAKVGVKDGVYDISPGGADVVFECTGLPECINPAMELARPEGTFVWQGNYGERPVELQFMTPHAKHLTMYFPSDDGLQPCRRAVVKNMAMDTLQWEHTITHQLDVEQAPEMYARINRGEAPEALGIVFNWTE